MKYKLQCLSELLVSIFQSAVTAEGYHNVLYKAIFERSGSLCWSWLIQSLVAKLTFANKQHHWTCILCFQCSWTLLIQTGIHHIIVGEDTVQVCCSRSQTRALFYCIMVHCWQFQISEQIGLSNTCWLASAQKCSDDQGSALLCMELWFRVGASWKMWLVTYEWYA